MTDIPIKAVVYILVGIAFAGLTLRPVLERYSLYNIPLLYILIGALSIGLGAPLLDPLSDAFSAKVIEHSAELIVIISLAGAGLAIDLKASWKNWQPTWRLLAIAMPLTIGLVTYAGYTLADLAMPYALLLGAVLAPTDPVLARSVQVGPPGSTSSGTRTALTSEAGLNDGLAFPFVWLAIGLIGASAGELNFSWQSWLIKDLIYRTLAGILVGLGVGWCLVQFVFSRVGDARNARAMPGLVLLAGTFLAYGTAELIHGYGFLAVFVSARAGRALSVDTDAEPYENIVHRVADQLEAILMAVLLLWLGMFIAARLWTLWQWQDLLIALALVLVIRPAAGWLSMVGLKCELKERLKISFFGIRGMGSIFYLAFAQTHSDLTQADRIWSIVSLAILVSAIIHGTLATHWMEDEVPAQDDDGV